MAIAFDSSAIGVTGSNTTVTFSHTCTGSDRFLSVDIVLGSAVTLTSVTYAGVAMTQIATVNDPNNSAPRFCYYLKNPATGANNVVVTTNTATEISATSTSYTGVDQNTPIDSFATASGVSVVDTTITASTTVVTGNCWIHGLGIIRNGTSSATLSSNRTNRQTNSGLVGNIIIRSADSGSVVATGSQSTTWTISSSTGNLYQTAIVYSFKPSASSGATFLLNMI